MRDPDFTKKFLTQPLDHFEVLTAETFQQPFYVVEEYWRKPHGPVFLYIGGEWNVRPSEFTNGNVTFAVKHSTSLFNGLFWDVSPGHLT